MKNIYLCIAARPANKGRIALAVVLSAEGSAPRRAGAAALFSSKGLIEGTVGGGSLEAGVRKNARAALERGGPLIVDFFLEGESLAAQDPVCGGRVRILVDPRPEKDKGIFNRLKRSLAANEPGVLVTHMRLATSGRIVLRRDWIPAGSRSPYDREVLNALSGGEPRFAALRDASSPRRAGREFLFLEPILPPSRLIIAGAGHIGRAVSHLGRLLDFEVTVIDDRREFANRKNLPDADHIIRADIGTALRSLPLARDVYVVIVTRGHANDADALRACVRSGAGYIGMVGSRTKIGLMRREFLARGWATARQFDRVRAPIGLPILSETVEEIAVSIAAELVRTRRELRAGMGKGGRT